MYKSLDFEKKSFLTGEVNSSNIVDASRWQQEN